MSHSPSSLAIAKGTARFSRAALLVALVASAIAALPLAYGALLAAFGVRGAFGYVASQFWPFLDRAVLVLVGWVVTGWLLAAAKRDAAGRTRGETN